MAGTFSVGESKTRPGVYHRRYSVGGGEVAGALNGVGMGIIRANWGPLNRAVAFEPSTNVNAVFGSGNTEDLITEMFSGGISSGYFVRCGTGGTAPTITLKDNAKADVVTITGAYVGDRAFSVSVRDSLTGDGRATVIAMGKAISAAMVGEKKLTSGDMYEDESNPPQGDSAWFILDIVDKDSLEHVYLAYKYRFATEVSE